jgi:hypothetical protein
MKIYVFHWIFKICNHFKHLYCRDVPFEKEATTKGIPQRAWKVELGDEKHHYHVGIYCP